MMTSRLWIQPTLDLLISSSEELPANRSALPGSVSGSTTLEATSPSSSSGLAYALALVGCSGRTSPAFSRPTQAATSGRSLRSWQTGGIALRGECWTLNTLEYHSDAGACTSSLAEVLEPMSEQLRPYCLSATAASGILRRAERRGKALPARLAEALATVAGRRIPTA